MIVLLDLDDGCAKETSREFNERAEVIRKETGKEIDICFCVREYESWFLSDLVNLSSKLPEYGIDVEEIIEVPESVRAAKETLRKRCKTKGYKQMRDQRTFTKKLDVRNLVAINRSFRKWQRRPQA